MSIHTNESGAIKDLAPQFIGLKGIDVLLNRYVHLTSAPIEPNSINLPTTLSEYVFFLFITYNTYVASKVAAQYIHLSAGDIGAIVLRDSITATNVNGYNNTDKKYIRVLPCNSANYSFYLEIPCKQSLTSTILNVSSMAGPSGSATEVDKVIILGVR